MENGTETPNVQQNRRMTPDWFRSPPTDYLNVSSVTYPRGSRATVAELEENDALVDMLYYRNAGRQFFRNGRQQGEEGLVQLFIDSDDFQDATADSTKYAAIGVQSKPLIDALRPALASVHYPLPDASVDQHRFYPPFNELFFAQGRILETLKHAGLGNVKEKQLRSFVTVMQLALKKLNHSVREMAGKRIVDFPHLWTLFPLGSFAVSEIRGVLHIHQVSENAAEAVLPDPNARKKEDKYIPIRFNSYGFDGYNFGCYEDRFTFWDFKGFMNISSLDYRPVKYEERFGDIAAVKKAVERGRKSLEYQSYHHCQYVGKCDRVSSHTASRDDTGKVNVNGRVVVDCLQARETSSEYFAYFYQKEHAIMPYPAKKQEIYNAMRPLFLTTQTRRPTAEEQEKRKQFFGAHSEFLMLMKPILPAWSLDHNDWLWVEVSRLEPVQFLENPMSRIVDSSQRQLGLLTMLVQRKLQLTPPEQLDGAKALAGDRKPLLVLFSGPIGTGKTATVKAIAELHQRPLLNLSIPQLGLELESIRTSFERTLENAAAWQAIVLVDNATLMLGENSREPFHYQRHVAVDFATMIEHFRGVLFMTKRDDRELVHKVLQQVQAQIHFAAFTTEKREKIWRSLIKRYGQHEQDARKSLPISEDTIREISLWELNGHEIEHLLQNILLLYPETHDTDITTLELQEVKALTCNEIKEETKCLVKLPKCIDELAALKCSCGKKEPH